MRPYEIVSEEFEPRADHDLVHGAVKPHDWIRFLVQFPTFTLRFAVNAFDTLLSECGADVGYLGDKYELDFNFDTKEQWEEFRSVILKRAEEITGRKLVWLDEIDDDDTGNDEMGEPGSR
jgi:hypothetical protein